jgi:predicted Abi (CAAX) family protease
MGLLVNMDFWEVVLERVVTAVTTIPDLQEWLSAVALLLLYALVALPIGLKTGFLSVTQGVSWREVMQTTVIALIAPGIVEELMYRVLLLHHPSHRLTLSGQFLWGGFGLIEFVVAHPLNSFVFSPGKQDTFTDPVFLLLATGLGIICTLAYWQGGSWRVVAFTR